MIVYDASALLAYLADEPGADVVEATLAEGGVCGAANWSEVAQKVRVRQGVWPLARALLIDHGLVVEPVSERDAERAAELWMAGSGLSLGDRLCLALGERLSATVLTADRAWGEQEGVRQIRPRAPAPSVDAGAGSAVDHRCPDGDAGGLVDEDEGARRCAADSSAGARGINAARMRSDSDPVGTTRPVLDAESAADVSQP